jgi:single-stranded DNA-binding protein
VPGFDNLLSSLSPGSLVYVEGNLRVTTKKEDPADRFGATFVNIAVTRTQGTFRLLNAGGDRGGGETQGYDDLPF